MNINLLKEKHKKLIKEKERISGLATNITQVEKQLEKAEEEKKFNEDILKEAEELKKKVLFEGNPFFRCHKCKKLIPVTAVKHIVDRFKEKIVIESECRNKKCELKVKHPTNEWLKHPVMYRILDYGSSKYKKVIRGHG